MPKPIQTALGLHQEMKKRGLQLDPQRGRDLGLLEELKRELECRSSSLEAHLRESTLTAEDLLRAFVRVAAPFARMFQEIWAFLAEHVAPDGAERIRVRFGFDTEAEIVDLEAFREWAIRTQRVLQWAEDAHWTGEAMQELFGVARLLASHNDSPRRNWPRYRLDDPYEMLPIPAPSDPFEQMLTRVHAMYQATMNAYYQETRDRSADRNLPEVAVNGEEQRGWSMGRRASLITDLLPIWKVVFDRFGDVDARRKEEALALYSSTVAPKLERAMVEADVHLQTPIDVLALPFWRDRWRTYEIWTVVKTLRTLSTLRPRARVSERYIAFDVESSAIIADLSTAEHPEACVAVQMETPVTGLAGRKAIKPDLSICYDASGVATSRAVVVETKQRARLEAEHVLEVSSAYLHGSQNAAGVVLVNYDEPVPSVDLPPNAHVVAGVRPGHEERIEEFERLLLQLVERSGLRPAHGPAAVLLDVSSSMSSAYGSPEVRESLRRLLRLPGVAIYRFADGLLPGGDTTTRDLEHLAFGGGTALGAALAQVESLHGLPDVVLVVTDGEYGDVSKFRGRIKLWRECMPQALGSELPWVKSPS